MLLLFRIDQLPPGAAWRRDRYGAVGTGDKEFVHFDPMVVTALAAHQIVGGAAGAFHSLAVTDMGLVFAWGDNSHGQARLPAVRSFAACASACGVTVCRRCSRRRRAHRRATADDGVSLLLRGSEHSVEQNRRGTAHARQRVLQSTGNGAKVSSTNSAAVGNVCLSIRLRSLLRLSFACLGWDRRSRAGGAVADTCLRAGEPYGPAGQRHTQCP